MHSLIFYALEWLPTQFVLQCDQWFYDGLKIFFHHLLFIEQAFGWALCTSPHCSLLFALHLDWSLNIRVDKKIIFSLYICEIVFHFSLWLKLSIFFSLVLFSLEMHNICGKKLAGIKWNVDRQVFKDVLCVTLLQEGWGSTNC